MISVRKFYDYNGTADAYEALDLYQSLDFLYSCRIERERDRIT